MKDRIVVGVVKKLINDREIEVVLLDGVKVDCILSSKIKLRMICEIQIGDEVAIELSRIDNKRGRITYRHLIMNKYFESNDT